MSTSNEVVASPNENGQYPPEPKVVAATSAAYVVTAILIGLMNGIQDEDHALILGRLPELVETVLLPLITAAATYALGWWTKHQRRRPADATGLAGGSSTVL